MLTSLNNLKSFGQLSGKDFGGHPFNKPRTLRIYKDNYLDFLKFAIFHNFLHPVQNILTTHAGAKTE